MLLPPVLESDEHPTSDPVAVTLTVRPLNDAPVAVDNPAAVRMNRALVMNGLEAAKMTAKESLYAQGDVELLARRVREERARREKLLELREWIEKENSSIEQIDARVPGGRRAVAVGGHRPARAAPRATRSEDREG
jgi:hypothetical protein